MQLPVYTKALNAVRAFTTNITEDLFHPRSRKWQYTRDWLFFNYRWVSRRPKITTREIGELFPQAREMVISMDVGYNYWNISPTELYMLGCIVMMSRPKTMFEFGTYDGGTTLQLARCAPDAQIYTLDLPYNPGDHFQVGSRFAGTDLSRRIIQLYGNSTTFDFSPYRRQIDLIFVDGGHDYEVVKKDTANALEMICAGGIIVWDDYLNWPGVKKAIEEYAASFPIFHLEQTKFAMLIMLS